jgi:exodeoxyribonuclease VII small subunit
MAKGRWEVLCAAEPRMYMRGFFVIICISMVKKLQAPPKNFEEALKELEHILAEIEAGETGLEQSLLKYERGNFLIQHCRGVLGAAEKQIEVLSSGEAGQLMAEPLVDAPSSADLPDDASSR